MRLANANDFFDGAIYSHYYHHEGFAKRAEFLASYPDPILVVGCGFGFLVDELLKLGKLAYGIDAARWAINQSEEGVAGRVWERSILNSSDVLSLSQLMPPLATVVTEDLLPYLSDQEAATAAAKCASLNPSHVVHLVTQQGQASLNWHSLAQWQAITSQPVYSLEGM